MWWLLVMVAMLVNTSATLEQRAQATGMEATQEVASTLKVVGIYGSRNSTSEDLWDLRIHVEMPAGSPPMDASRIILRYSDGIHVRTYAWAPADASAHHAAPHAAFAATWIRGDGTYETVEPGDLVELRFNLVDHTLAERTDVRMDIIPESGAPLQADFRTPATYSTHLTVTLR